MGAVPPKTQYRKVFLDDLPRVENGRRIGSVSWKDSVGRKVGFIYGDLKGEIEILSYIKNTIPGDNKIEVKYNDRIKVMKTGNFSNAAIGNLVGQKATRSELFIGDRIKDDKRDLVIIDTKKDYANNGTFRSYVRYHCNICGYDSDYRLGSEIVSGGKGCSCCAGYVVSEKINSIPAVAPWMVMYFLGGYDEAKQYTPCSRSKIFPICPDCLRVKQEPKLIQDIFRTKSIGCLCGGGKSFPEKMITNVIEQLGLKYIPEYSPEWLRGYKGSTRKARFDFYLPDYQLIVEPGGVGHGGVSHSKSKVTPKEAIEKDKWKDKKAQEHGLIVIRINTEKSELNYIKNNMFEKLGHLFDLDKVDWDKVEQLALSNTTKEICDYYMRTGVGPEKLDEVFKLHTATIRKHLKRGAKFGWCDYDSYWGVRKKVEIYKDGLCVGTYDSSTELSRRSLDDFGIELLGSSISSVANGRRNSYKGYTFKYINKKAS